MLGLRSRISLGFRDGTRWSRVTVIFAMTLWCGCGQGYATEKLSPGRTVFIRECSKCHEVGPDAKNRIGPHLNGLIGRKVGSVGDFKHHSKAFREKQDLWTLDSLRAYLRDPRGVMGGNMLYKGLQSEEDLSALVDYLQAQ